MLENTFSLNSSAFAGVDEKCCETGILIQLNKRPGLGMEHRCVNRTVPIPTLLNNAMELEGES